MLDHDRLHTYLTDHLGGAASAIDLLQRRLEGDRPEPWVAPLLHEVEADKTVLEGLIGALDADRGAAERVAGWAADKALGGVLAVERARHGELGDLLELEVLQLGVAGKRALWVLLGSLRDADPVVAALPLDELVARAEEQHSVVEQARIRVGADALGGGRPLSSD